MYGSSLLTTIRAALWNHDFTEEERMGTRSRVTVNGLSVDYFHHVDTFDLDHDSAHEMRTVRIVYSANQLCLQRGGREFIAPKRC